VNPTNDHRHVTLRREPRLAHQSAAQRDTLAQIDRPG